MQIELVQVGSNDPKLDAAFKAKVKEVMASAPPLLGLSEMSISAIARTIRTDWGAKVNYAAKPYLDAMDTMNSINDKYYEDSGKSIITYFLGNAQSWRGEIAKGVKAELNRRLKS